MILLNVALIGPIWPASVGAQVPSVVEHAGVDVPTAHEWHWLSARPSSSS